MNEIDPAHRFSMDAVRKFDGPAPSEASSSLNDVARQVASQYRRDTMSPIMVSGV
ncbi:undecaprenyl-phosphate glucose phosphotransferase, partial [bacterium M00.F.Ca.ET.228.01.1.1]